MLRLKNLSVIFLLILFLSGKIYSQQKFDSREIIILKQDFAPILDSLVKPPSNCEEAWGLVTFDTLKNDFAFNTTLENQDNKIQKLLTDITTNINKTKLNKSQMPEIPSGGGPPQGGVPPGGMGPPGGMNMPEGVQEIREDMEEVNNAVDKINVLKEKFKNELTAMQYKVNENLHKTLETDYDSHINILNDFMKSALNMYNQYNPTFKESMKKIDGVIKKYDYGTKIKFDPLKKEFLELQLEQINILELLLNITKEFTLLGAKFYNEKQMSLK
jgi:hypothetical protein